MKRILLIIVILILTISFIININKEKIKDNFNYRELSSLAIKVETDNDSNTYELWKDNTFPKEGYVLNSKLSTCQNGSTITWNNGSIILKANKSDKCTAFFDKVYYYEECDDSSLACYIAQKQGTQIGDNNEELILHSGKIDVNKDGIYDDAGDLSYRYSGDNPDNFVCFGTEEDPCPVENLYRIIGVFPFTKEDGTIEYRVKLIKSEYITGSELETEAVAFREFSSTYADLIRIQNIPSDGFYWDDNGGSAWKDSTLFALLNTNYCNKTLTSDWRKIISSVNWHTGSVAAGFAVPPQRMYTKETKLETINSLIGLMYVSDYGFASSKINWSKKIFCSTEDDESCYNGDTNRKNNWLFNSTFEWTIINSGSTVIDTNWFGDCHSHSSNQFAHHVRPVFYLKSDVKYISGSGTESSPYRIV